MGASYGKQKRAAAGKLDIAGRWTALPHSVIHSVEYRSLGHAAARLLFDVAAQYNGQNNGKLVCCAKYLKPLGWNSHDTVTRAQRELIHSGLLIQTRQGMKPPCARAAWFAIGWLNLDVQIGIDICPRSYRKCKLTPIKAITPIVGITTPKITPTIGVGSQSVIPIVGAVRAKKTSSPIPIFGAYIDLPSKGSSSISNNQQIHSEWINANAGADAPASALIH